MRTTLAQTQKRFVDYLEQRGIGEKDRIPAERELVSLLGASRTTVRRMLANYEKLDLISREGQGGTFLRAPASLLTVPCETVEAVDESSPSKVAKQNSNPLISVMIHESSLEPGQKFIHDFLLAHGHLMNVYMASEDHQHPVREKEFLESLLNLNVKGLMAYATPFEPLNTELFAALEKAGTRVAHFAHYRLELPDQGFFLPDYECAGRLAAQWMAKRNVEKITISSTSLRRAAKPGAPYVALFEQGVRMECEALGLKLIDYPLPRTHWDIDKKRSREMCLALPPKTGVVGNLNTVTLNEMRKAYDDDFVRRTLLFFGFAEDVQRAVLPKDMAYLAFNRERSLIDALSYLIGAKNAVAHKLYKPELLFS